MASAIKRQTMALFGIKPVVKSSEITTAPKKETAIKKEPPPKAVSFEEPQENAKKKKSDQAPAPKAADVKAQNMNKILGISRLSTAFSTKPQSTDANRRDSKVGSMIFVQKRFRPIKRFPIESRLSEWLKYVDSIIFENDPRRGVICPPGISVNDWITVNLYAIYNQTNDLYGSLLDYCTAKTCPKMTAGSKWEYKWGDGKTVKKPISIPARDYIDYLMTWIDSELDDPMIYPTYEGSKYAKKFLPSAKVIVRRMLRVYGHMENHHEKDLSAVEGRLHLDLVLKHFLAFAKTFKLLEKRALEPFDSTLNRWKKEKESLKTLCSKK